jgi:hypothetical protein
LPLARLNIPGMSGKAMSATNPTVVNVVLDIIKSPYRPGDKILDVSKSFFGNPIANWMIAFCFILPFCPTV